MRFNFLKLLDRILYLFRRWYVIASFLMTSDYVIIHYVVMW